MAQLEDAQMAARQGGWSQLEGNLDLLRFAAARVGWEEVAMRSTESALSQLVPVTRARAHRYSISAVCGMSEQPLHTDGAHMPNPPDLVVLTSVGTSTTPTLLMANAAVGDGVDEAHDSLRAGVFMVTNGGRSFLATAFSPNGLRYDPLCMTPCDARARRAAAFLADRRGLAIRFLWDRPSRMLIIDNTVTMHARAAVDVGDEGRMLERVAFRTRTPNP